jgi:hypothetical protein
VLEEKLLVGVHMSTGIKQNSTLGLSLS